MTEPLFRHDNLLTDLGYVRGNADNTGMTLESAKLRSGSVIEFEASGVTAIAGANNCGKSTLLSQIRSLLSNPNIPQNPPLIAEIKPHIHGTQGDFLDWLCKNAVLVQNLDIAEHSSFQRLGHNMMLVNLHQWNGEASGSIAGAQAVPFFLKSMSAGERNVSGVQRKSTVLDPPSHPLHRLAESAELMAELNRLTRKILGVTLSLDDLNSELFLRVGAPTAPYPSHYEDPSDYQMEMNELPMLASQGDGMKSLLGILIPLITATYPILIIDEPEAFLHPPQAFALGQELGQMASERQVQIILATHDRNILAGLLNSSSPLSVVRLVRNETSTVAHQLKSQDLKDIWDDPVLKYSNILDGLFHELAVLAENERDCRFYEAALDARTPSPELNETEIQLLPPTDVLFLPTSGTGGMPKAAKALRALKVPVIACPDLDVLDNEIVLGNIVESLGGTWEGLHDDWATVTAKLNHGEVSQLAAEVNRNVKAAFDRILASNPMAIYDGAIRRTIKDALGLTLRPWDEAKNHGVEGLMRVCDDPEAVKRLLNGLVERQVVVVNEGQLESFGHSLGVKKGKEWLPAALRENLQASPKVQDHISRILEAAEPMLRR